MSVQLTVPDYITPEPEKPPIVLWLGATWNQKLAYEMGDLCSQEFAIKGASIWWSPAINLHRTAYSGRNFEYFAEDGVFSGLMGTQWVKASQANGVVTQLKHFFLNDQETNRGANSRLATFADEQTMRELYLKPFQMCIEDGGAMGTVNTMCRIGTVCSPSRYSANVNILRNEWGMTGAIITDAQSFNEREKLNRRWQQAATWCAPQQKRPILMRHFLHLEGSICYVRARKISSISQQMVLPQILPSAKAILYTASH